MSSDREQDPVGENEAPAPVQQMNIKVTDGNNEVFFKIKRTTKLGRLMRAFCDRQGKDVGDTRFRFDGERVTEDHTPADLEMEDGDGLEVFNEQVGGCGL